MPTSLDALSNKAGKTTASAGDRLKREAKTERDKSVIADSKVVDVLISFSVVLFA
jgi:hypothetical protein